MGTKRKNSEAALLELYRGALSNAASHPKIKSILSEIGYDEQILETGKQLYAETRKLYDECLREKDRIAEVQQEFQRKRDLLNIVFAKHRDKALVIFRKDKALARKLMILGAYPRTYVAWTETLRKFYQDASEDQGIQTSLSRLKLSPEEIEDGLKKLDEVSAALDELNKAKADSQHLTNLKKESFFRLEDWMKEFYMVAGSALEEQPQLQEALGKVVRR